MPQTFQKRYEKQPKDEIPCRVDFSRWLAKHPGETIAETRHDADGGIAIRRVAVGADFVDLIVYGGELGRSYRAFAEIRTTPTEYRKRIDVQIKVRGTAIADRRYDGGFEDVEGTGTNDGFDAGEYDD